MKLYNCFSKREKELKEIELQSLTKKELVKLAREIKKDYEDAVLEDETIVIDALTQIIDALI